ncbi:MAG: hypothetical protein GXY83_35390 [Rhodopirellula sp.]|nr:hypothetical protein [Rhodopirellula sp.]
MKRWQHLTVYAALLAVCWAAWGTWQWHEYGHQCQAARETLVRQASSIAGALVGGIRSHRRMGPYFADQLQATIEELLRSQDILAVALCGDGETIVSAGKTDLLGPITAAGTATAWTDAGFLYRNDFHLDAEPAGGYGPGGGFGRGRGSRWRTEAEAGNPFSGGGDFAAWLLLDRHQADRQCADALRLRAMVVVAGGGVFLCIGLAWMATIWFFEAHSRAGVLEAEARHLRDLSQAAAGLAHETRNPLGLIRGWTQRLAESNLPSAEQRDQARAVIEECDRVTARINQFLAFAKPVDPAPVAVAPASLFAELAMILEPDLDSKHLKLELSPTDCDCRVSADPEMLRQAMFNLLQNAIQFSPERATVEVRVRKAATGGCRIEVADRGPGVPGDKIDLLFTPYFTTRSDGTGLGLAIVRRIATAHGWQTGYTPRSGGGATFWLEIHD